MFDSLVSRIILFLTVLGFLIPFCVVSLVLAGVRLRSAAMIAGGVAVLITTQPGTGIAPFLIGFCVAMAGGVLHLADEWVREFDRAGGEDGRHES